ncbi:diguanylate cyclase, partial [Mycobacterium tuberculosis]|nr:diguanylate cyclase [Mycobacterium tuberculosis]
QQRLAQNLDLQRRLEEEAQRDHLTGLFNRRHAHAVVPGMIAAAVAARLKLTVIVFDLDHFKSVNDEFGHAVGDAALKLTADI